MVFRLVILSEIKENFGALELGKFLQIKTPMDTTMILRSYVVEKFYTVTYTYS